ncbi:sugar phosphorylase [Enterococcus villorum]|uniref:Sucrose phosphorylase n=1 Tax=Enterococcus villorum TaxID=112904 RepID=A0A1V8YAY0_9ENTE|nr:alpha-amylase family glycosyl hydrolase [Enterococcus villorum]OQO69749.1 sugar phosphorylase [Enterococcus villorum]OQO74912.1 sugar phosphorylase [Enterococcus villorum]
MYKELLKEIYQDSAIAERYTKEIEKKIKHYQKKRRIAEKLHWDEQDIFLITYGDQFFENREPTLRTFKKFYQKYLSESFSVVHFLPFFPYTSDDGFSVVDYQVIDEHLGTWEEVEEVRHEVRLMVDFVCNHMSAESTWFQEYLNSNNDYKDFFIELPPDTQTSSVTRPRTSPLLTKFIDQEDKEKYIWTTFSADQVDLNFKNPKVLMKMIDILLFYLEKGADFIRLDAVGFLWKELGTTCIHLPETHKIIQLFRAVVDKAALGTVLITETNVPHKDNISYFGNGHNEAQMVYQFSLPPLALHAIRTGNTKVLKKWLKTIDFTSKKTTFFNFLASHDGIGLNPVRGILPETEISQLVEQLKEDGALVNNKQNSDGTVSPYEINATYLDALSSPTDREEWKRDRFLVAHSLLVTLPGVPAVYIQSVLGSQNDYEGVAKTGENRKINRKKYALAEIETALQTEPLRKTIYEELTRMLIIRKKEKAFHPNSTIDLQTTGDSLISFIREADGEQILVIHNFSDQSADYLLPEGNYRDLFSGQVIHCKQVRTCNLQPYEYVWLKIKN